MRLVRLLVVVIFAALCPLAVTAQSSHPLLQRPAFNGNLIAFSYAGDLWTVDRNGGRAARLTTGTGIETDPVFSPDGRMIAFTGEYDGNTDVFVVPATGGVPQAAHLSSRSGCRGGLDAGRKGRDLPVQSREQQRALHEIVQGFGERRAGDCTAPAPGLLWQVLRGRKIFCLFASGRRISRSIIPLMFRGETTAAGWRARYGLRT